MQVIKEEGARPIKAWVGTKRASPGNYGAFSEQDVPDIEDSALSQLKNIARLPFIHPHGVAAMPDVHAGIGATVGSVIATEKAIIPAAVGVDIGCGMNAVRTSLKASDLPDNLAVIRGQIERDVPNGFGEHHDADSELRQNLFGEAGERSLVMGLERVIHDAGNLSLKVKNPWQKTIAQFGTLGGGNHFIELCLDENQDVWVMLHSGSRGIGNAIGSFYIEKARRRAEEWFIHLPDRDLAYFPEDTDDFRDYTRAVSWAQDYALENRHQMMTVVLAALKRHIPVEFTLTSEAVNCHHNYVEKENHFGRNVWVTRKGAIRAREGDLGIIPGSMGTRSYIVRGRGNPDSYCSCSHGAGRRMSRAQARKQFTTDDLKAQTHGVECRKDSAILDEIPGAYKDVDQVMANQTDLVEIVHTLRAVLCVKGA